MEHPLTITMAIVQARTSLSRLPGQVLQPISDKPMAHYQLVRPLDFDQSKWAVLEKHLLTSQVWPKTELHDEKNADANPQYTGVGPRQMPSISYLLTRGS